MGFPGGSVVKNLPTMHETQGTLVWSLGHEDLLEKEMATHSGILARKNLMDRGAWWATVHGVTNSWTWLKPLSMHSLPLIYKWQKLSVFQEQAFKRWVWDVMRGLVSLGIQVQKWGSELVITGNGGDSGKWRKHLTHWSPYVYPFLTHGHVHISKANKTTLLSFIILHLGWK